MKNLHLYTLLMVSIFSACTNADKSVETKTDTIKIDKPDSLVYEIDSITGDIHIHSVKK